MSSNLIIRRKTTKLMCNTIYKKLKYKTNTSFLDHILNKTNFVCFVQIKSFNSNDYVELKKYLSSLNLNIYLSKKIELHHKINSLFSNKLNAKKLVKGNLAIIYSVDPKFVIQKDTGQFLDFMGKNPNLVPLYFYMFKRFIGIDILTNLVKTSLNEKYYSLISLLASNGNNVVSILQNKSS